jgi:hypothetical protein
MCNIMFNRSHHFCSPFIQRIPAPAPSQSVRSAGKLLLLVTPLVFLLVTPASATTYTVKAGGGGNFTTIQACINAMSSSGGDTCVVYAGTYNETPSIKAGTTGNYNVLIVNAGDPVTILGSAVNSHTKINGFTIQNPSNPYTSGCVDIPIGTTDAFITNNSMAYCGGPGATEDAMITGHHNGTSNSTASFIYIQNNTLTHGCSAAGVNDVCESISLDGDHFLIEGNDLSHNDDAIEFYASYVIARNNYFHDTNQLECSTSGHGSNCHPDMFETEPSNTTTHPSQYLLFEGNRAVNFLGTDAHAVLTQADLCGGQCFNAVIRSNSLAHVGSYGIIDDNAHTTSVPGFSFVKSYNNDWVDFNPTNFDVVNAFTYGSSGGAEINDIFYFPESITDSPYYVDSSSASGFTAGSDLAYCTGTCNFQNRTQSGSFASDATGNLVANPNFANYSANDFHLVAGSPAIGGGAALTTASGAGVASPYLTVVDASFFQDGWGFPTGTGPGQVSPDWIRIGTSTTVQISSINYSSNVITLASAASWNNGDPVYLYKNSTGTQVLFGSAPDLGAYPTVGGCTNQRDSNAGTTTGSMNVGQYSGGVYSAIPFIPGSSYTLCGVTLRMAKVGNPLNVNAYIYSDSSGVPGMPLGMVSTSLNSSTLSSSEGDAAFVGLNAPLTAGTQYWIVVEVPFDNTGSDYAKWYYSSGSASNVFESSSNGSAVWSNQNTFAIGKFTTFSQ